MNRTITSALFPLFCFLFAIPAPSGFAQLPTGWKAHDLKRPLPEVVTPAENVGEPPSDAIVLFNGKDLTGWTDGNGNPSKWKVVDGTLESVQGAGPIFTEKKFGTARFTSSLRRHRVSKATVKVAVTRRFLDGAVRNSGA